MSWLIAALILALAAIVWLAALLKRERADNRVKRDRLRGYSDTLKRVMNLRPEHLPALQAEMMSWQPVHLGTLGPGQSAQFRVTVPTPTSRGSEDV